MLSDRRHQVNSSTRRTYLLGPGGISSIGPARNISLQILKQLQLLFEPHIGADPAGLTEVPKAFLALKAFLVHQICTDHCRGAAAACCAVNQNTTCRHLITSGLLLRLKRQWGPHRRGLPFAPGMHNPLQQSGCGLLRSALEPHLQASSRHHIRGSHSRRESFHARCSHVLIWACTIDKAAPAHKSCRHSAI